jgi:hypothetical protein
MKQSGHPEYQKLLSAMKNSQKLKRLVITVALKGDLIELLNKSIGSKDANLRQLQITFANPQGVQIQATSGSSGLMGSQDI